MDNLYKVTWQQELWHTTYILADNELEAKEKILRGEYRVCDDNVVGSEIQEHMEAFEGDITDILRGKDV